MIPVDVKKLIQQIGLEHGLFYQIVKTKQTIAGESDTASKKKKETKRSIFKFEGQSSQSKQYFSLEENRLKTYFKTI